MDIQALSTRPSDTPGMMNRTRLEYLWAPVILMAVTLAAHGESLKGTWRWDDGAHLSFVTGLSPWQYFFIPKVAQAFSPANVSPWSALFYDLNLKLFGLNAAGHYAHILAVIAFGAILFYAVLREWLPPLPSMVGAAALLLGKPTVHIAAGLMHGHYATGFAFTMLAILGWTKFIKGGNKYWLATSVAAYFLATICKEVYVPLVVLLPFLPTGTIKQKLRALLPFIIVAAFYTGWRYWLLGKLWGGYDQGIFSPYDATRQMARIPGILIGTGYFSAVFLIVVVALTLLSAMMRRLNWMLIVVALCVVTLPLIPLTAFPGINGPDRYLFATWIAFSALLATLTPLTLSTGKQQILAASMIAGVTMLHNHEYKAIKPNLAYWDAMYRFALSADKAKQAIFVAEYGGSDDGYKRLVLTGARATADLLTPGAQAGKLRIVDESGRGFYGVQQKGLKLYEFREGNMEPMSPRRIEEKLAGKTQTPWPQEIPLEVSLTFQRGTLHWKFGPQKKSYIVWYEDPSINRRRYFLEHEGQTAWTQSHPIKFSFCLSETADDFDACSPVLEFDFKSNKTVSWQGIASLVPSE